MQLREKRFVRLAERIVWVTVRPKLGYSTHSPALALAASPVCGGGTTVAFRQKADLTVRFQSGGLYFV